MSDRHQGRYRGIVVQSFPDEDQAMIAIRALQDGGFTNDEISVVTPDEETVRAVPDDGGTEVTEGAAVGAITGGALTGIAALIVEASAVAIPGVGLVIGGPIAAAIAGAAGGGLLGALTGAGIPENEAHGYNERVKAGDVIVTVVAGHRDVEARQILQGQTKTEGLVRDRLYDRTMIDTESLDGRDPE